MTGLYFDPMFCKRFMGNIYSVHYTESEKYLEASQTSKMELFAKIIDS